MTSDWWAMLISIGWGLVAVGVGTSGMLRLDRYRNKVRRRRAVVEILSRRNFEYRSEYEGTVVIYFIDKGDYDAAWVVLTTDRVDL